MSKPINTLPTLAVFANQQFDSANRNLKLNKERMVESITYGHVLNEVEVDQYEYFKELLVCWSRVIEHANPSITDREVALARIKWTATGTARNFGQSRAQLEVINHLSKYV